jgi:hypothetical protein
MLSRTRGGGKSATGRPAAGADQQDHGGKITVLTCIVSPPVHAGEANHKWIGHECWVAKRK